MKINILKELKFHFKRAPILIAFSIPSYLINLATVTILVQLFDFHHLEFLSVSITGTIVATIFNFLMYDYYTQFLVRWKLIKGVKPSNEVR